MNITESILDAGGNRKFAPQSRIEFFRLMGLELYTELKSIVEAVTTIRPNHMCKKNSCSLDCYINKLKKKFSSF